MRLALLSRPQSAESTTARLDAISTFSWKTAAFSTAGTVFGMSTTVVTPPAAAAAVSEPKSSLSGKPGSRLCTCASMPPGSTSSPRASTSCAPTPPPRSRLVMTPPAMWTSASRGPPGVQTVPLRMTVSDGEIGLSEQRRERHAQPVQVLRCALLPVQHGHQPDHGAARCPHLLDRPDRLAAGREHVFDHGDAVARLENPLQRPCRAVVLGLLAYQHEWQIELQGDRGPQQHRPKLGRRKPLRGRRDELGQVLADPAQDARLRLEQVLVEVVVRTAAGAEHEVALQPGSADQITGQPHQFGAIAGRRAHASGG